MLSTEIHGIRLYKTIVSTMIAEKGRWLGSMCLILIIQIWICMNISSLFMIWLSKIRWANRTRYTLDNCTLFKFLEYHPPGSLLRVTLIWNKFFWHFFIFWTKQILKKVCEGWKITWNYQSKTTIPVYTDVKDIRLW